MRESSTATKGYVHSIQSLGALDGPGLRTVVFMQGCPLKCKFCINIDATIKKGGKEYSPKSLVDKILKNREYWESYQGQQVRVTGGVTFSGGEPLYQPEFLDQCLRALHKEHVHTVVDTCLYTTPKTIDTLFPQVDYWMVSLKQMSSDKHLELTGVENTRILENCLHLDKKLHEKGAKNLRIRFVLIPGLTDSKEHILELAEFVAQLKSLDVLELLPYSSLGRHKWIENFGQYPLEGMRDGNKEDVKKAAVLLQKFDIKVKA